MNAKVKHHYDQVLSHLYINPLEKCNLRCKICYTRKTSPILTPEEILEFVGRYGKIHPLQTITFCGGEVFTLPYFPELVNKLTNLEGPAACVSQSRSSIASRNGDFANHKFYSRSQGEARFGIPRSRHPLLNIGTKGIFVQIITNGTIDRLSEFASPNMVNLIVSLDGLREYHDKNRGEGNFDKSMNFLKKAKKQGFHTEIFSIVTGQNLPDIDKFENYLSKELGKNNSVTYHPRKPPDYLIHHPISNIFGETDGFDFLNDREMVKVMRERKTFPPKDLGCYQIALVSDGRVYGCCEGVVPVGKIDDDVKYLFDKLWQRLEIWDKTNTLKNCLGCSQSEFMCGIKKYLTIINN